MQQFEPGRPFRFGDDDLGDIVAAGIGQYRLGDIAPGQGRGLAAQSLRQPQRVGDPVLVGFAQCRVARTFDIQRRPFGLECVGDPARAAHQFGGGWLFADADQDALAGGPGTADGMRLHIVHHVAVDMLGDPAQGEFAQGRQIAGRKEMAERPFRLRLDVNLAFAKTLEQVFRRQIDKFDFIGFIQNGVRHGFAHMDAGDLGDDVIQAFDVLDIDGGEDVDTRSQHSPRHPDNAWDAGCLRHWCGQARPPAPSCGLRWRMASRSISATTRPL